MLAVEQHGCHRAWCSDTRIGRLCACVTETSDDTSFTLAGRAWTAPALPPLGGDASHFRIDDVGEQRIFLAMLARESVGIAISDWLVWRIDAAQVSKPLRVHNYGTLSFPTKRSGAGECRLLAAQWQYGEGPRRRVGTYLSGAWYALERGEFARMPDRPTIYQRYLFRIERARFDAESEQRPLLWFRRATTSAPQSATPLFQVR
jgi:hypothetical protein